ncbi:MAG: hypothetical protein QM766_10105 [Burkholderiaceae bacterium]
MSSRATAASHRGRTDHPQSVWQVFRIPLLLGVLTIVGLVSALVGDDGWDLLSWLALLTPIAAAAWGWHRRG